ncbi:putative transcription factor C3H family [Helianthus annuus]|nr:putative transcription factor C3H family [Helianthus annuus]
MDYCQESGNVVQIITRGALRTGVDNMGDQAIWVTDDEYVNWNNESLTDASSNSNHNGRQSQTRFGSETPNRKPSGDSQANNRSKAIGKMFFKTKMCCKFRVGTCRYVTNCNFAHSVEELRKPPPNWQEIVAAHEDERSEPREEYQIPSLGSSSFIVETQKSYKGRHCKKFYTEEGWRWWLEVVLGVGGLHGCRLCKRMTGSRPEALDDWQPAMVEGDGGWRLKMKCGGEVL